MPIPALDKIKKLFSVMLFFLILIFLFNTDTLILLLPIGSVLIIYLILYFISKHHTKQFNTLSSELFANFFKELQILGSLKENRFNYKLNVFVTDLNILMRRYYLRDLHNEEIKYFYDKLIIELSKINFKIIDEDVTFNHHSNSWESNNDNALAMHLKVLFEIETIDESMKELPIVKKQFNKMAKKYHPDTSRIPNSEVTFQEKKEAYDSIKEILKNA